jgi:ribose transport system substrate-binding protein
MKLNINRTQVIIGLAAFAIQAAAPVWADAFTDDAKAKVSKLAGAKTQWDGPTSGPKASPKKTIVFVAADMKNGGILGASKGVEEAAKAIGWNVRVLDGQGSVSARTAALNQALALKPDGIVVGGFDTTEQKVAFANATKAGMPLVGWNAGPKPGPDSAAGLYANVTTTADDISEAAALWAIADSGGTAGVVIFTDSQYSIAVYKAKAMEAVIKKCPGCTVLSYEDSPIADSATRMPGLTTSLLQRFGAKWTHSLAINDLYFDFMGGSLKAAGKKGDDMPRAVSAGDGSEAAFQRIRSKNYQSATVPGPLNMQGWQIVDEMNRAFAKVAWSGYVPGAHVVTSDNVNSNGGAKNIYDPENGYRAQYQKIWGTGK